MNETDIAVFWDRLTDINAGLLGTDNGAARIVPMSHQILDGDPTIWFITARDTDLAEAAEHGAQPASFVLAEGGKGLYAIIRGALAQNKDPALRDALWSTVADSWFKRGKSDPDVCILGLVPETAEVWLTPTSGLSFAFNVVRAQVTGEQPDMGAHGTLAQADLARRRAAA
jgi:general stress protein 26